LRVLLLSAYTARSHVYWQECLLDMFPDWQWNCLGLPPRYFSWRVRGNPLYWALREREVLEGSYDLLIATSMVDLATLRGLVPGLATVPTVLYFHENQFAYPQDRQQHSLLEAQMVSLYSALAADRLLFNSRYNQETFFSGLAALLRRLPDKVPGGIVPGLTRKASVVPVPLKPAQASRCQPGASWPGAEGLYPARPLRLVWVGRLEHDKGGDTLLHALRELKRRDLDFELAVIGQQFRNSPPVFANIEQEFASRIVQFGYLDKVADYRQYLADADVVLSTAEHEFQGLAVLEAVAAGALPAVPDTLVYPEIFPGKYRYDAKHNTPGEEAARLICDLAGELSGGGVQAPDVQRFSQENLTPLYRAVLGSVR
jgi:glycosyltransferase involved in cell wall biosynthesis